MTEQMPSDAALIEAAKRNGWSQPLMAPNHVHANVSLHAGIIELARMIEKYEPNTLVDPVEKMLRDEAEKLVVWMFKNQAINPTDCVFKLAMRGYELGKAAR
jgi:hypothetical protein